MHDGAFDEFPFDVEKVAHAAVGVRGLPGVGTGAEGDVREVEESVVVSLEVVGFGVGVGVDEGDAGADGFGLAVEVGEVAELGGGGGHGVAHLSHAYYDEVDVALAVGGDEAAVEGEVGGVVGVAGQGLQGDGLEVVEEGGFECGVRFLREGLEYLG